MVNSWKKSKILEKIHKIFRKTEISRKKTEIARKITNHAHKTQLTGVKVIVLLFANFLSISNTNKHWSLWPHCFNSYEIYQAIFGISASVMRQSSQRRKNKNRHLFQYLKLHFPAVWIYMTPLRVRVYYNQ
jgi:hypothetical protein